MTLTAHWPLDDNAASTTIVATVGSNGTLNGGDNTSVLHDAESPGGSISASLHLNGSDDYLSVSVATVSSGSAGSWSIWFKLDDTASLPVALFGSNSSSSNNYIGIPDTTTIRVRGNGTPTMDFTVPTLDTNWHHCLVAKSTSNDYRVFVDGVESSTGTLSTSQVHSTTKIGARDGTPTWHFDGSLAYAKVFNSDESANAASLYAEGFDSDTTPPEVQSITINEAGTEATVVYDEAVSGDEETGWSLTSDGGALSISSASGSGTATHTWTLSRTVLTGETITADYEDGTGNLEDAAANALADVVDFAVTNDSTETGGGANIPAIAGYYYKRRRASA